MKNEGNKQLHTPIPKATGMGYATIVNPVRACAARVTVVVPFVCVRGISAEWHNLP